ncbi:alpha-l-rhamnosidase [Colletotrichum asianum]|uniref:alpha-L-rhamnosidase n=1 Tax=Colletotrichum asianum TaxID=702518 RepID=A0A8H3ZRP7_9PEZI|nr:alpha-l-rhamnosidase [Colletotrichum asianum]
MRLPALLSLALVAVVSATSIEPESLRTEGVTAPLGIHATKPLLSWRLQSDRRGDNQTSYQLQAASSSDGFDAPDLWDTGKLSDTQAFASWNGSTLGSRDQVYWRVRAWDADDVASSWSEPSRFELGLLEETDWTAQWIENNEFATGVNSLPLFANEFKVNCTAIKARLYITGLGVFYAEFNSKSVSDEVLGPGYSTINRTVLYRAYDVTDLLAEGDNVIGVSIGKGISTAPQLKVTETIAAKSITQRSCGYLFDFGVNFAGWYQFSMNGTDKAGTRIVLWPAERLVGVNPSQTNTGSPVFDGYTLAGNEPETYGAYGFNLMHTIADAQAQYGANSEGLIPTTAPEYDVFPDKFRDDPNWGSAIMRVAMHLYRYYGDTRVLSENYDIMVAYMDYLGRRATDSVIEGVGLSD